MSSVRLGQPDAPFDCWKVWERGAPELCIEIMSKSDADYSPWKKKLERYRKLGVRELVGFDPKGKKGVLRIWDRDGGDLVERDPNNKRFLRCKTLQAFWCVQKDDELGRVLRLAHDAKGNDLFPTLAEQARQAQRAAEQAQRRVRELEEELRRRG